MLSLQLEKAGFFPIQWALAEPGVMYVRPSAQGVLRVFVPAGRHEVVLYTGSLAAGELRYRGPVPPEAELRQLLANGFGRPLYQRPLPLAEASAA
ncbi:MAG: hypothetical protein ACRYF0_05790 [Janthinobacterium lividum]